MLKKILPVILAGSLLLPSAALAAPSTWAKSEVEAAIEAKIVPERLMGEYQSAVTREEFCEMAMLVWCKLTGKEMPAKTATFADTQNASVAAAQSLGIVQGESPTQFSPNNPVTRQEMSVMLKNALGVANPNIGYPESYANTFPDGEKIADWAMEAVKCMNLFGVMLGDEKGNINPLDNTTREQAILLAYRLYLTQTVTFQEYVETMLMPVNGNTHDNMLGGAFAAFTSDGKVYYANESGIFAPGGSAPIVAKPAKSIVAYSKTIYYIGADNSVYMVELPGMAETRLITDETDSFSTYSGHLYYRNLSDNGRIYKLNLETKENVAIIDDAAELVLVTDKGEFYTTGESIYKCADSGAQLIYTGINKFLCYKNGDFYFINKAGQICKISASGANYFVLSKKAMQCFNFTRDCLIAMDEAGYVYKVDFEGRYTIKMDTDTYVAINTYDDYVYARNSEGAIYKFSNNGTEKTRIN